MKKPKEIKQLCDALAQTVLETQVTPMNTIRTRKKLALRIEGIIETFVDAEREWRIHRWWDRYEARTKK